MNKSYHASVFIFLALVVLTVVFAQLYAKRSYDRLSGSGDAYEEFDASGIPPIPGTEDTKQEINISGGLSDEQKILSFDMTGYTKDGKRKWDIRGQSADIISDIVILNDLRANSYNDDRTVNLKAERGKYDKKKNTVKLENDVVITTSDGVNLTADWFQWESETDLITTESYVEVEKDNLFASGYGAEASTRDKEVHLARDIVVKQDDVTIICEGPLTIDYEGNKASFYERVKVTEPRGELLADRLDIFFNKESRQIESVVAERNVELRHGDNFAKGQKIIYTLASGEVILTGNPEIIIYSEEDVKNALAGN